MHAITKSCFEELYAVIAKQLWPARLRYDATLKYLFNVEWEDSLNAAKACVAVANKEGYKSCVLSFKCENNFEEFHLSGHDTLSYFVTIIEKNDKLYALDPKRYVWEIEFDKWFNHLVLELPSKPMLAISDIIAANLLRSNSKIFNKVFGVLSTYDLGPAQFVAVEGSTDKIELRGDTMYRKWYNAASDMCYSFNDFMSIYSTEYMAFMSGFLQVMVLRTKAITLSEAYYKFLELYEKESS